MRTPANIYASELQAQHTIESDDLLKICRLAKVENVFDKIESFSFEQFFGFACHLFITTESRSSREQLAHLLPKFGSIAVFSLLKISHHLSTADSALEREQQLAMLSMQSLKTMSVPTLVIGLAQIIETEIGAEQRNYQDTMDMVVPALITLTAYHGENILSVLSDKLSAAAWNDLQQQLLQALSTLRVQSPLRNSSTHPIKVKVKNSELQLAEVAC
ncbi:MAG: hypothetical protein ACFB0D_21125 [Phormidesmis sp.]